MKTKLTNGFYTALGTPLNDDETLNKDSFARQIDDQIKFGASGLLIMGSMGIEAYVRNSEYSNIARTGLDAAAGRCPIFVGVMDTSISRVIDRIKSLEGMPIDGVVATVPYYNVLSQDDVFNFFQSIAAKSPFPVYMYDLAVVTKTKITTETALRIMKNVPNVKGIKSGDAVLARILGNIIEDQGLDFSVMYSGLDTFDVVYDYGIKKQLDGMFACTAPTARKMYDHLNAGAPHKAAGHLDSILSIRNKFVELGVFPAFTAAMNLLGYSGRFHPDYIENLTPAAVEEVRQTLIKEQLLS